MGEQTGSGASRNLFQAEHKHPGAQKPPCAASPQHRPFSGASRSAGKAPDQRAPRCGFVSHPCREGNDPPKALAPLWTSSKGSRGPFDDPSWGQPAPFSPPCCGSPPAPLLSLRSSCPCRAPHGPSRTSPPPAAPPPASPQPRPTATPAVPWKSTWSPPQTPRPPRWAVPGPRRAPFAPALPQKGQTRLYLEQSHFNPLDHPPVRVPVPCPQVPACFESCSLDPASPADRSRLRVKVLLQQLPPQDCDVREGFIRCCPPRGFISSLSLTSFTPCRSGTAPASPRRRGSSSEPSAPAADGRRWGRGRNVPCQVPATAAPARR